MNVRLSLSAPVFNILSALIEERLGLFFDADYRELLEDRLGPRALERGFESMLDYYYFLRYDADADAEFLALADVLTVNETYFLREAAQLRVLARNILPEVVAQRGRARVWCAACSTGEEPLTLAALLSENQLLHRVDLVASDISARALAAARRGSYGARSLRAVETLPAWLARDGDRHTVSPELRSAIDWRRINLLDAPAIAALGRFDVIVCRNVLIYFRDDTTKLVVSRLHGSLVAGGWLLVGASESLLRLGTAFECEERGGTFFYRKSSQ